jgi:hypothetical protein
MTTKKKAGAAAPKKAARSGVALDPGVLARLRTYRNALVKKMEERVSLSRAVGIALAVASKK